MPYQPGDEKEVYQKKPGKRGQDKKERKKRKPITEATKAKRKENLEKKKKLIAEVKALYIEKKHDPSEIKQLLRPEVRHKKGQGKTKLRKETYLEKLERLRRELTGEAEPTLPAFTDRPKKGRKKPAASQPKKKRKRKRIRDDDSAAIENDFTGPEWKVLSQASKSTKSSKRSKKRRRMVPASIIDEKASGPMDIDHGSIPPPPSAHSRTPSVRSRRLHQSIIPSSGSGGATQPIPQSHSIFEDPQNLDAKSVSDAKSAIDNVIEAQSTDGKSLMDKIEAVKKGVQSKEEKLKKCNELLKACEANRLKEQKLAKEAKNKAEVVFQELNEKAEDLEDLKESLINQSKVVGKIKAEATEAKADYKKCEAELKDRNDYIRTLQTNLFDEYDNARDCKEQLEKVESQVSKKDQQLRRCEEQLGRLKAIERVKKKLS